MQAYFAYSTKTRLKTPKDGESHKNKNHASKAMNCFYVLFLEFFRYYMFRNITPPSLEIHSVETR